MSEKSVENRPENFERIRDRISAAGRLLLLTHARPDGDALGSMVALASAARAAGKSAEMLIPNGHVPWRYEFLYPGDRPAGPKKFDELAADSDLVVILDTCALAQLDGLEDSLEKFRDKIVVVDHHRTGDDIGSLRWVDISQAATGMMVRRLLKALGWPMEAETVEALATAVVSDTGWFSYGNTDADCLRAAAELFDAGVKADVLYRKIYQSDRPQRLKLLARILDGMELYCDDRLAVMCVTDEDFKRTGAKPSETENLINAALNLATVEVAVMLVQNDNGIRVSLRSRDGVDVSGIAQNFGGGGHARAAGATIDDDIRNAKDQLITACCRELNS